MSLQNPINRYECPQCGGFIVTIDRDEGVTPFMLRCRASKDCNGMMQSCFYQADQSIVPSWEWRKPTKTEYFQLDLATRRDHVDRGGLLLYPIRPPAEGEHPKSEAVPKKRGRSAKRRRMRDRANTRELMAD